MNDKMKQFIKKQNQQIVDELSSYFGVNVYQDDLAEDEEVDNYHFFVFETGEMIAREHEDSITQDVYIHYVSENRDDVDEQTLDIISILRGIKFTFVRTSKERYQKGETDAYLDRVSIQVRRKIKIECPVRI
jgi:hypothetical protein